jgi:hypothetical protein
MRIQGGGLSSGDDIPGLVVLLLLLMLRRGMAIVVRIEA